MSALVRAFQEEAASGPASKATYETGDLAHLLASLYARGRSAHPKLAVSEVAFGRRLARALDAGPPRPLDTLSVEDLYLAFACAERVRGAGAAFEAAHTKAIRRAVSRVIAAGADRDDAVQRVLQHLLVGEGGAGGAIASYPGRGPLAKWVPVVALRIAIKLNRSETSERRLRQKAGAEALGLSPEDLLIRAELRRGIEPAVAEALGRLEHRDRLILRLYLVGGMTLSAIGVSLGLTQQAISKRLASARERLMEDIRASTARRFRLTEDEFSSLMRVVASQLEISVSRALRTE
jgi:RNA polymerase sigma-70 factor, ECF subfamily